MRPCLPSNESVFPFPAHWFVIFTGLLLAACGNGKHDEALGTLERDRVVLKATASEIIVAQPLREGSLVEAGTLLVQLDDRRQRAKVAQAEAEVARASARFEELRSGARVEDIDAARARVDGARATLVAAEKNYRRNQQLVNQQLTSEATLDTALANRDSAEAELESATKALLVLTNGTRKEELDQGEAELNAARAQLDLETYILGELSIEATRDGYLDNLPWNEGERVSAGTTVAVMLANGHPFARVYIPERWRTQLHVGDALLVRVDGVDENLQGRLRWIANDPSFTPYYALNQEDRSRLVYLAEVELENGEDLPTGVPAQVLLKDSFSR